MFDTKKQLFYLSEGSKMLKEGERQCIVGGKLGEEWGLREEDWGEEEKMGW